MRQSLLGLLALTAAIHPATAVPTNDQLKEEARKAQAELDRLTKQLTADPYSAMPSAPLPSGKVVTARRFLNQMLQGIPAEGDVILPAHMKTTGGTKPLKLAWSVDVVGSTFLPGPTVRLVDSDMVFAGSGVVDRHRGADVYAGTDLRGKTVIIVTDNPNSRTRVNRSDLTQQWLTALDRGAAAVLWVTSTEPAATFWDTMRATWGMLHQAPDFRDADGRPRVPLKVAGILSYGAAKKIFSNSGSDFDAAVIAAREPGFRAMALPMKASMTLEIRPADEFDPVKFKIPE